MKATETIRALTILLLRVALVLVLVGSGLLIYNRLPPSSAGNTTNQGTTTPLQIVLRHSQNDAAQALDISVDFYPIDLVAVTHEYFTEPRAGKRFDDFLKERMKGRSQVSSKLDKQGRGFVLLVPGSWWLHAKLSGEEEIEWRLPVRVNGSKQTIELTSQNAYTRSKSF